MTVPPASAPSAPPASARPAVRAYRREDLPALYDICVRTAHEGQDSRHLYPDPDLMPSIFAAPYAVLEPELTFVLDDGHGQAVGYVLGTADTAAFARAFRTVWLPTLTGRYPAPAGPPRTPSEEMIALMHDPERLVLPELAAYPAHLHIDLLPDWQRKGHGRALMFRFLGALREKGVDAAHLSMVTANTAARAFYDRLGFRPIEVPDPGPVTYLGRSTTVE
ncbi:GNAT family N-acetyltransferase [Streptomyces sp. SID3212]|uniref:GNAT family N-acetyltransferase n=1 Tax=Streptomyces sp. SID3212 TaxID=2690259 RepID=UPI00136A6E33|nr:GNAT family N-acetyltransferase [Streptomyces sp. SID3212]MYV54792.1 GNAT family N-acetyltransferase [Streptomyces sp. SID3212]